MSQRTDRVDELLRQEIGQILAKELADPRIGFATITDVETAPDLRHAKVWVSVIGGKTDRTETVRALQASMGFVRHELGQRRIGALPHLGARDADHHAVIGMNHDPGIHLGCAATPGRAGDEREGKFEGKAAADGGRGLEEEAALRRADGHGGRPTLPARCSTPQPSSPEATWRRAPPRD